uniref:Uncharacterized protein n=1 Tax=Panagrolaimus davidi TaxID=227884 RepID=A0A914P621_9BILA
MRKQNPIPSEATLLERDIVDNYRCYQRALEQVMVVDELYTKLAYFIMRAESYWYAAKVTSGMSLSLQDLKTPIPFSDTSLRHHFYALARHNYADLLMEARAHLKPDDKSLLTILEKMSQILVESGAYDPELVAECQKTVFLAEKALESTNDVKRERKIIKIKTNLLSLNSK